MGTCRARFHFLLNTKSFCVNWPFCGSNFVFFWSVAASAVKFAPNSEALSLPAFFMTCKWRRHYALILWWNILGGSEVLAVMPWATNPMGYTRCVHEYLCLDKNSLTMDTALFKVIIFALKTFHVTSMVFYHVFTPRRCLHLSTFS